jgi:hypothetical protein
LWLWQETQLVAKKACPKFTQVSVVQAGAEQAPSLHVSPEVQELVVHAVQPVDCFSQVWRSAVPEH